MAISFSSPVAPDARARGAGVTAVLGPTNTGKTHLAIERMLAHSSGIIGLPLRLLAREVFNKIADRMGPDSVALVTGEEKIKPPNPRYWVSTVEAMPRDLDVAFLAVDEVQLAADFERGHVFTDRMLNRCGQWSSGCFRARTCSPGRASHNSLSRGRRRSPACRAAPPSSPFRPKRSTPLPN
jgi:ATP-dependent RNA helicase SUPV3L1/SUV3